MGRYIVDIDRYNSPQSRRPDATTRGFIWSIPDHLDTPEYRVNYWGEIDDNGEHKKEYPGGVVVYAVLRKEP